MIHPNHPGHFQPCAIYVREIPSNDFQVCPAIRGYTWQSFLLYKSPPTPRRVGIKADQPTSQPADQPTYRHRLTCRRYTPGLPTQTKPPVVFFSGANPMRFFSYGGGGGEGGAPGVSQTAHRPTKPSIRDPTLIQPRSILDTSSLEPKITKFWSKTYF